MVLTRGWHMFARARGLGGRCTLHFKYEGLATLYVRVFGEDRRRVGCCPEDNDGGEVLSLGDGCDRVKAGLSSAPAMARPAMATLLPATAPAAAATTSRHAVGLASRTVAGHPVVAPR